MLRETLSTGLPPQLTQKGDAVDKTAIIHDPPEAEPVPEPEGVEESASEVLNLQSQDGAGDVPMSPASPEPGESKVSMNRADMMEEEPGDEWTETQANKVLGRLPPNTLRPCRALETKPAGRSEA